MARGLYRPRAQQREAAPTGPELTPREAAIRDATIALQAGKRALKIQAARRSLRAFIELCMPDPEFPDDPDKSLFDCEPHHQILIEMVEAIEAKKMLRVATSMPPQHGKSLILSRFGLAWILGRSPHMRVLFATYADSLAETRGEELRATLQSQIFKSVFPKAVMSKTTQSKSAMVFVAGGSINLLGRGSGTTGRPADMFIIDDPFANEEEGSSETIRRKVQEWYSSVVQTRCPVYAPQLIVHCMTGETPVLMSDGSETRLRDICPGDEIATYRDGYLSTSTVVNWANQGPDPVFEIKMASGAIVKANARHPFLVRTAGELHWLKTSDLSPGCEILRAVGVSGKASRASQKDANPPPSAEATALPTTTKSAGPMECERLQPTTLFAGELPTSKVGTASPSTTTTGCTPSKTVSAPSAGNPQARATPDPTGAGSCASTTATTLVRFARFCATTAISLLGTSGRPKTPNALRPSSDFTPDRILEIRPAGIEDVFDIEVAGTENFIANGLVAHNTRWSEDDLIGWLCDPEHPANKANPTRAQRWKYLNIPTPVKDSALAEKLGLKVGDALWPKRFPLHHLQEIRENDPRLYAALYEGSPSPADGDFFKDEHFITYLPHELPPKNTMRFYAASDHAVGTKQRNDASCYVVAGVDEADTVWIVDCWWERKPTDVSVEAMIDLMKKWEPLWWRAASDHISKSVGPFLRQRMRERKVYGNIVEGPETGDKVRKAQAIQARMSMKKVRFPAAAHWTMQAKAELLKFPHGKHDDFVDAISHLGRGLRTMVAGAGPKLVVSNEPRVGSLAWVKYASDQDKRGDEVRKRLRVM